MVRGAVVIAAAAVLVTTSTVITMIVGTLIPAVIAVVTRASLPARAKTVLSLLLVSVSGVVASIVSWPTAGAGWWHLVLNVLMTFATAAAADPSLWGRPVAPSYVVGIHRRTDRYFGIGQYDPNLALPAAA
jgi:hypothetical protein